MPGPRTWHPALELWNPDVRIHDAAQRAAGYPGPAVTWADGKTASAESDGLIVGSLIVTFDGWRGNMYRLAVRPDVQRRGIARRLVDDAHTWLRGLGCRRITALVEGDHDYATSFWESAGYTHDAGMRRYSKDFD